LLFFYYHAAGKVHTPMNVVAIGQSGWLGLWSITDGRARLLSSSRVREASSATVTSACEYQPTMERAVSGVALSTGLGLLGGSLRPSNKRAGILPAASPPRGLGGGGGGGGGGSGTSLDQTELKVVLGFSDGSISILSVSSAGPTSVFSQLTRHREGCHNAEVGFVSASCRGMIVSHAEGENFRIWGRDLEMLAQYLPPPTAEQRPAPAPLDAQMARAPEVIPEPYNDRQASAKTATATATAPAADEAPAPASLASLLRPKPPQSAVPEQRSPRTEAGGGNSGSSGGGHLTADGGEPPPARKKKPTFRSVAATLRLSLLAQKRHSHRRAPSYRVSCLSWDKLSDVAHFEIFFLKKIIRAL
jgi:hypothetical protein